jgi:hypothetical protein
MKKLTFLALLLLSSCSYSINQVHTEGTASDVVDETQKNDADVKPSLNIPIQSTGSGQSVTQTTPTDK